MFSKTFLVTLTFPHSKGNATILTKMGWATFREIFSQIQSGHPVHIYPLQCRCRETGCHFLEMKKVNFVFE
jgi:hypothetical protein